MSERNSPEKLPRLREIETMLAGVQVSDSSGAEGGSGRAPRGCYWFLPEP
jgi:hypothetical protein